jgi:superfamily I DNA/RNA helicase/RecB family exonuclease
MPEPAAFQLVRAPATRVRVPVLDPSQQRVLDHPGGPLLVLAGPGTGKTTTLVEAVVDRVERRGLGPDEILVLTFSRRAAAELRARIAARLGRTTRGPAAWTFHSFCFALVRRYDDGAGQSGALRLLSGPEQFLHVRRLLRGDADEQPDRWPAELRPILLTRGFAEEVRDLLLRAQERGLSPEGLAALAEEHGRADWRAAAQFYQDYLDVLAFEHALDYAGLVRRAGDLLTDPQVAAAERARYAAVFVDEYQDTDLAQERLLQLLAGVGADLTVVGDPDQSIYGFRGAEVSGLLEFADRFRAADRRPARVLTLGVSRRAGNELLAASRAVAVRLPAPGLSATKLREHRALVPAAGVPDDAQVVVATYSSAAQEAMGVADALRRAHLQDDVPWREMAVLVRSGRRTIPTLRRALVAAGVPVAVAGDEIPLADDPAVTPLLTLLRSAIAPERVDEDRAELLLTTLGGADAIGLRRLRRALRAAERAAGGRRPSGHLLVELVHDSSDSRLLPADVRRPVERVAGLLAAARAAIARGDTVEQVLWTVWEPSVLRARLERQARGDGSAAIAANRDLDAVVALFDAAARFVDQLPRAGAELFLDDLDAQEIPAGTLSEKPAPGESVRLLTAHRAKGLEWDVVAVAGVQDGQWPDLRRRGSLLGAELLRDPSVPATLVDVSAQLVEERRLFYVAATRARRRLIVTAVDSGDDTGDRPSRFLGELGLSVPERPERPPRVLSLRALVGELRHALTADESSPAIRDAAAATLARLAAPTSSGDPLVPAAHPDSWWGLRPLTDPGRPLIPPGDPVRVSPSAVEQFRDCPLQWFMKRQAGVQTQAGERQSFGNLLHAIAELAASDPARATPEAMVAMLDEVWPQLEFEAPWYAQRQYDVARRAVLRICDFQSRSPRKLAGAEVDFETAVGDALLVGKVDRLEVDDHGRAVVVDFKTSSSKVGGNRIREHPQLALYQVAVESGAFDAVGCSGGAELVQLRVGSGDAAIVERQQPLAEVPELRARTLELLSAVTRAVLAEAFPARPNAACSRCAVARCCPAQPQGEQVLS